MKLLIVDCDTEYSSKLSSKIAHSTNNKFTVKIITKVKLLTDYLSNNEVDILLLDNKLFSNQLKLVNVKLLVLLTEGNHINNSLAAQTVNYINKYQRVSSIVKQIYSLYSEINPNDLHISNKHSKIICIYSCCGGVGKTTIAISLARKLTLLGNKVFYLNLENYSSIAGYFTVNQKQGLSELLKVLKNNKNVALKAEALKKHDTATGIYYINEIDNLLDLEALTKQELEQLINILATSVDCDYLIIDSSSLINQKTLSIFDLADKIILVSNLSSICKIKLSKLISSGFLYEQYKPKLRLIFNKSSYIEEQVQAIPVIATIPKINCSEPLMLIEHIAKSINLQLND